MIQFHKTYRPLTSRPFLSNPAYQEYQPGPLLSPFISCYWSEEAKEISETGKEVLVIPDSCMDIIVHINYTTQKISGFLCCMNDQPFISASHANEELVSVFAIRFYFWSAHLFFNLDFKHIKNQRIDLQDLGWEWNHLFEPFFYMDTVEEKIRRSEQFLLKKIDAINQNHNLFHSFHQIISGNGRNTVKEICDSCCVSQRQLERQFLQTVGLPMKRVSNLVRYQNVWRDMMFSKDFNIQDAVYRYGYADQSHLLKEFKRFHGVTPEEARKIADQSR